jgi:hypothetical protein
MALADAHQIGEDWSREPSQATYDKIFHGTTITFRDQAAPLLLAKLTLRPTQNHLLSLLSELESCCVL